MSYSTRSYVDVVNPVPIKDLIIEVSMKFTFKSMDPADAMILSGEFVKDYMLRANGAYLKFYLFILYNAKKDMSVKDLAFELELTENDVHHAIEYWKKLGLISEEVKNDIRNVEDTVTFYDKISEEEVSVESPVLNSDKYSGVEKAEVLTTAEYEFEDEEVYEDKSIDIIELGSDQDFDTLIYFIQQLRKKTLSNNDVQILAYLYKNLGLSVDLLEYLVEICVQAGKTSMRYMEKIALDWHSKGIDTVDKAKNEKLYSRDVFEVIRIFGMNSRGAAPIDKELQYINKWLDKYAFTVDIIKEAYDRTVMTIRKPSIQYADSILSKWYSIGVKVKSDINVKDIHKENVQKKDNVTVGTPTRYKNKFNNFDQREQEEDLEMLARNRLNRKLSQEMYGVK